MMALRTATKHDLPLLSALCQRSKAFWGYDAAFMAACRAELTIEPAELRTTKIAVADTGDNPVGMVQIGVNGQTADLKRLYVDPDAIGCGHGAALMRWAVDDARRQGAIRMTIEADPNARPFYERMGARLAGKAPSGSIPGRIFPLLELSLA